MTNENTEDIYDICLKRKSICCNRKMGEETCSKCKTYKMYKLGLEEGRNEIILEECANDCKTPEGCDVFVRYAIFSKKTAELEEQINQLSNDNHILKTSIIVQQEQIEELKKDKEWLDNTNNEQTKVILELQDQIEKMKCCYNCKHENDSNTDYYCEDCKRFANETDIEKWELAE